MSLSYWDEGSDSDHVTSMKRDIWLVGHRKIPASQRAKLPRYGREGAVEVRPFTAKKRPRVSEAQGLSGEAMNGNPMTTVIPGVDESKSSPQTEDPTEPANHLLRVQDTERSTTTACQTRKTRLFEAEQSHAQATLRVQCSLYHADPTLSK